MIGCDRQVDDELSFFVHHTRRG